MHVNTSEISAPGAKVKKTIKAGINQTDRAAFLSLQSRTFLPPLPSPLPTPFPPASASIGFFPLRTKRVFLVNEHSKVLIKKLLLKTFTH